MRGENYLLLFPDYYYLLHRLNSGKCKVFGKRALIDCITSRQLLPDTIPPPFPPANYKCLNIKGVS